jgi:hypothetical protein
MIAEEYLGRSRLFRRLKSGPHGQLVELYAVRLVKDGLARQGTWRCLSLVGDLLSWIARSRSKLTDFDERMVERYLRHRAGKQFIQPGDRAALKRLLSVLRDAGTIAPAALPPITPQDQIFEEFSDYLRRERGLAPKSIIRHLPRLFGLFWPLMFAQSHTGAAAVHDHCVSAPPSGHAGMINNGH